MGKGKNKELKNKLNQTVQGARNPWVFPQTVQEPPKSMGPNYSKRSEANTAPKNQVNIPNYDMTKLMDKAGGKIPPAVKQMMEQFMNTIPTAGAMNSPNFKKEMKKKMKCLSTTFKSPYE